MRTISLVVLVLFLFLILALSVQLTAAQTPAPTATPTPSPTPSLLPKPVDNAANYWDALVRNYGAAVAFIAALLAGIVAFAIWFFARAASGVGKTIEEQAKKQTETTVARMQQPDHLREYLENFRRTYAFLDLKSLDERGHDAAVRLSEVYIPLRARGAMMSERDARAQARARARAACRLRRARAEGC